MKERIQKILSASGIASRRKAEEMIAQGRVTVNGITAVVGQTADADTDVILLDGKPIAEKAKPIYIMLHKPRGYVTTLSDEKSRKDITLLIQDCPERVYPIGRLDMDSEGLLLLTNDGDFANRMMHPSHVVEKEYLVDVSGFSDAKAQLLSRPIVLDGYRIAPPKIKLISSAGNQARINVIIHEGRNRQIRRMCDAAQMKVQRLKRVREGNLSLGNLPLGQWRYLSEDEIEKMKN